MAAASRLPSPALPADWKAAFSYSIDYPFGFVFSFSSKVALAIPRFLLNSDQNLFQMAAFLIKLAFLIAICSLNVSSSASTFYHRQKASSHLLDLDDQLDKFFQEIGTKMSRSCTSVLCKKVEDRLAWAQQNMDIFKTEMRCVQANLLLLEPSLTFVQEIAATQSRKKRGMADNNEMHQSHFISENGQEDRESKEKKLERVLSQLDKAAASNSPTVAQQLVGLGASCVRGARTAAADFSQLSRTEQRTLKGIFLATLFTTLPGSVGGLVGVPLLFHEFFGEENANWSG